ncbi:hypothetical protein N800_02215 [Lysobacter daejeonensis GH1-9]|uniref:Uncharacterized protein n=1 Tax=Lysobacter daejeonensis GH1-9 TaxID=1385517 RepID=A0A0A0EXD0_9GAMM|nr:hypothetical protein [Lysobacter daejeonensis]KGM54895.1 hypothetical protein N800_02215 [Lysobacter daejeonensis GH1-9]
MSPVSRDPLTPEERELASRLSRIGPHGEPPAALDARILSAAHAALATAPRRHRRWPAVLGVAATLALAVGISWQMRLRPEAELPALEEGPAAAPQVAEPHAEAADAAAAMPPVAPPEAETKAKPEAINDEPQPQRQMVPPVASRSKVAAPQEPPVIIDSIEAADEPPMELAPAPVAAAPPAPPPAPPAPVPAAAPTSEAVASDRAAAASAAKSAQRSTARESVVVTGSRLGSAARIGDREPRDIPVEEDTRLAATAWLDRIRLRQAAEDVEGARASLALFRRHFPDHAIPQDLAPLAQ